MSKLDEKAEELRALRKSLGEIELDVLSNFTLADAIREGSSITEQACGWGNGASACAMHAAVVAAKSRDFM